jgi:hypothetical protein
VYQGQKVPEAEIFGRGAAEAKGAFWQRCALNFLGDRMNYEAKDIIGKITNLFCIYFFQIHNYVLTIFL